MRILRKAVGGGLAFALGAGLFTACGGSDEPSQERIAREREDAAQQARQQEKLRQLERELNEQRRASRGVQGGQSRSQAAAPPSSPPSGRTSCGGGISVGPNTSCAFAQNVRDEYRLSGGSARIDVFSPVTKRSYTMTCTAGVETVCTGGNNASVYFR